MEVIPVNRFISIEPIIEKEESEKAPILVPDNFKPKTLHGTAKVLGVANDCNIMLGLGDRVVIDNSMVQEINVGEETTYLILENHVLCVLED